MANYRPSRRKKRGRQPNRLCVKLFLLDPEKETAKVSNETCSKENKAKLMQEGYGPPQPAHCTSDTERVEFSFELTNEQFKQKVVEIYPKLENACFVFMKADKNNKLEELNPGRCCYRCYTPENVYHSERGQGRLYIRKIAENQISQCTHGVPLIKRLCAGNNQQRYLPILPKQSQSSSTITNVGSSGNVVTSVTSSTPGQLLVASTSGTSGIPFSITLSGAPVLDLSSSSVTIQSRLSTDSSGNVATQGQLPTSIIVSATPSMPPVHSSVNILTSQSQPSASAPSTRTAFTSPIDNSSGAQIQGIQDHSPISTSGISQMALTPEVVSSVNMETIQSSPSISTLSMRPGSMPPIDSSIDMAIQGPITTHGISQTVLTPPIHSSVNILTSHLQQPPTTTFSIRSESIPISTPGISQSVSTPLTPSSVNMITSQLQPLASNLFMGSGSIPQMNSSISVNQATQPVRNTFNTLAQSRLPTTTTNDMRAQFLLSAPAIFSRTETTPPCYNSVNMFSQGHQLQTLPGISSSAVSSNQFSRSIGGPGTNVAPLLFSTPIQATSLSTPLYNAAQQNIGSLGASLVGAIGDIHGNEQESIWQQQETRETLYQNMNDATGLHPPNVVSNSIMTPPQYPFASPVLDRHLESSGLSVLANTVDYAMQRDQSGECRMRETMQRDQSGEWPTHNVDSSNVQGNFTSSEAKKVQITTFLKNVRETKKLEISLDVLNNSDLLKKLNDSTINIHTLKIESTCKLHQVVKDYSLPSSVKVLRIKDNYLEWEDVIAFRSCLSSVNRLHGLDLSRTKFGESSFYTFIGVLTKLSNLSKLYLAANSLTDNERACLTATLNSMKNLTHLDLSKSNLTETQAKILLQKVGEPKGIAYLDLSRNALQENEIITEICQLQSLQELNLSHNYIKFFPLPTLEQQHDSLPINTQIISLSSNHMTAEDIVSFCSLIRSDLLKLNLDSNHVGNSIWAVCSTKIKHLKILNSAKTEVCGPAAVEGLAFLLSLVKELEELDISSNNLNQNNFQDLQSPLSNLTCLKKLNLSNNLDGISCVLQKILSPLKHLEELRLSNVHLYGEDLSKISATLASLERLKCLDLSENAVGPEGAKTLAGILNKFPLLERLDLSRSCMKEDDISILCNGLTPLKNLKYLNLSGNRIAVELLSDALLLPASLEEIIFSDVIHGEKLFANMRNLQDLRKLQFSEMKLGPCDVEAFSSMLSCFPLLEELALTNVVVAELNWERIFSTIKWLKNIRKLDLSGIQIRDEKALVEMLSSLSCLEELVFSDVYLQNMREFWGALESLRCLKNLDLHGTSISETDAEALVRVLLSLQFLEKLELGMVNGNSEIQKQLFDAVGQLRYLKKLNLKKIATAAALSSLLLLEELVLEIKLDDVESQKQLFHAVGKLRYLKKLHLSNYKYFRGCNDSKGLAAALSSLLLLKELVLEIKLDDFESQKQLFYAVGKLRYLKKLHLSNCKHGCVPIDTKGVAAALSSLLLLEELVLKMNLDDVESQKQLFYAVGKLKYLKKLHFSNYKYFRGCNETKGLAAALSSLLLLEELVLKINLDDVERQKQVFYAVGKLRYLKKLHISSSAYFCECIDTKGLAAALSSLLLLEELELEIRLDDVESQKQLFYAVGNLRYLKKLHLGYLPYRHDDFGTKALAAALSSLLLLEELVLEIELDDVDSQKQMFYAVGKLRYLKKLYLRYLPYRHDDFGTKALAAALSSLLLLEELVLKIKSDDDDGDDDDDDNQKQLFDAVGKLRYLKKLTLHSTKFTQNGVALTFPSLHFLEELELVLILFKNKSDQQLFAALPSLKYLRSLNLKYTEITQTATETLITILPTLHNLKQIRLPEVVCNEEECTHKGINEDYCPMADDLEEDLFEAAERVPGLQII